MDGRISTLLMEWVGQMFMIGFMMAAPIIGTMFVVDVGIGVLTRTVPQMNVFAVVPPVKIVIHFALYIICFTGFFYLLRVLLKTMFGSMSSILKIMGWIIVSGEKTEKASPHKRRETRKKGEVAKSPEVASGLTLSWLRLFYGGEAKALLKDV